MGLRAQIEEALSEYILANVDQLSEGVLSFEDHTTGGSDEDGDWVSHVIYVTYRVPREINRFGMTSWRFNGTLDELIFMLDHWKDRY